MSDMRMLHADGAAELKDDETTITGFDHETLFRHPAEVESFARIVDSRPKSTSNITIRMTRGMDKDKLRKWFPAVDVVVIDIDGEKHEYTPDEVIETLDRIGRGDSKPATNAVEATIGASDCEDASGGDPCLFVCSVCNASYDHAEDKQINFCPCCGRRRKDLQE